MKENGEVGSAKYMSVNEIMKNAISMLTDAYASNSISIDAFENAVTGIERANSIEGIREVLVQLNIDENALVNATVESIGILEKITAHGSRKVIDGTMLITKKIEVEITHSKLVLDYGSIQLPAGEYELFINGIHSICVILLPEGINIDNRINEVYSEVKDKGKSVSDYRNTTIRLVENLTHSEIKIKKGKRRQ